MASVQSIQADEQKISDQMDQLCEDFNKWSETYDYSSDDGAAFTQKQAAFDKKMAQLQARLMIDWDKEWKASMLEDDPGPDTQAFIATITDLQKQDAQNTIEGNRMVAESMKEQGVDMSQDNTWVNQTTTDEVLLQYFGGDAYDSSGNVVTTPALTENDFTQLNTDTTETVNGEQVLNQDETFEALWQHKLTMKAETEMDDNQDGLISQSEFTAWLNSLSAANNSSGTGNTGGTPAAGG